MLRTAMKPRLLRLLVVAVVLIATFIWLGNWQWRTAHNKAQQQSLSTASKQRAQPIDSLLKPQTEFPNPLSLRPVTATGRYDTAHTELVAGRRLQGKSGWWLLTPLVVDGSGARLPVVRGFVTQTTKLPKPPSGTVSLTGALAPGESVSTLGNLPEGQIGTIDLGKLLNEWDGTVYNAFIFLTEQRPATAAQPGTAQVQFIPPPVPQKQSFDLRNAAYALQWWIFAAFVAYAWVKLVREEHADDASADRQASTPAAYLGDRGAATAEVNETAEAGADDGATKAPQEVRAAAAPRPGRAASTSEDSSDGDRTPAVPTSEGTP